MRAKKCLTYLFCCLAVFAFFASPAFASKQKYTRQYQQRTHVYQQRTKHFQNKDFPNARAYLEVSRNTPKVTVEYDAREPSFETVPDNISCNGRDSLSCTSFAAGFSADADCETSLITLKVKENIKVTLSSANEKGSCRFDRILKHELAHVEIYKKTLKNFTEQAKQELIADYKTKQQKSKGCEDIRKSIADLTEALGRKYSEKARAENAEADTENGEHKYNFSTCEPSEKSGLIETRRRDEDNQAFNRSGADGVK